MLKAHPVVFRAGRPCGSLFTTALTLREMPLLFTSADPDTEMNLHAWAPYTKNATTNSHVHLCVVHCTLPCLLYWLLN